MGCLLSLQGSPRLDDWEVTAPSKRSHLADRLRDDQQAWPGLTWLSFLPQKHRLSNGEAGPHPSSPQKQRGLILPGSPLAPHCQHGEVFPDAADLWWEDRQHALLLPASPGGTEGRKWTALGPAELLPQACSHLLGFDPPWKHFTPPQGSQSPRLSSWLPLCQGAHYFVVKLGGGRNVFPTKTQIDPPFLSRI